MHGVSPRDPMVADGRENGQLLAHGGPEWSGEHGADIGPASGEVAVVVLTSGRIPVVPGGDGEPGTAVGHLLHQVGLISVDAVGIHLAPVTEDVEGESCRGTHRHLGGELRGGVGTEQVHAVQVHPVAVLSGRRQGEAGLPLVVHGPVHREGEPRRRHRGGQRARAGRSHWTEHHGGIGG